MVVRLIGIKEKKEANGEAVEFLQLKTKGQKVFLKYDETKHDENNHLMVYIYLKNKTFLNAQLLKNGLADVDLAYNYQNKNRFINYQKKLNYE